VFICICRLVTRAQIEALVHSGARTVDQIGVCSSAGTDCGKCRRNIARILEATTQRVAVEQQLDSASTWGEPHAR
jgi:assimilatory nitrate reductase catalytic subunit